jgi:hypothetical protein
VTPPGAWPAHVAELPPKRMKCHVGHTRPPTRALWSTFGPHAIGVERFATVSSGRSFAQVAGAILRKQAHGQNPPGSSGDHADHPHVRDQFGRPRATSTPHNWHNFLRCHEQAAECRHPAVMVRSKPLRDELGPPVFGPVSPTSGSSRRRRPTDAKRSGARSGPLHVLRGVVAQDGQAHRVVTHRRRPGAADVRRRVVSLGMRDSGLERTVSGRGR